MEIQREKKIELPCREKRDENLQVQDFGTIFLNKRIWLKLSVLNSCCHIKSSCVKFRAQPGRLKFISLFELLCWCQVHGHFQQSASIKYRSYWQHFRSWCGATRLILASQNGNCLKKFKWAVSQKIREKFESIEKKEF